MTTTCNMFEQEQQGETLVLTPATSLGEFAETEIRAEQEAILRRLGEAPTKNVVVDFGKTDYFGSSALGFFLRLWKLVRGRDGHMAFCNLSAHEREILVVCRLDSLWSLHPSRAEALKAVRGAARPSRRGLVNAR